MSAGDGDCPQDGTYGPFGDEAAQVLVILIIARRAGAAAAQVGPPFLFMAPKDGTHDDTPFTITPPPPVLRATIRSEAVQWEVSWTGRHKVMITAIVLFFLVSVVALDVARRRPIGRKYVTPRNPWAATAPASATQAAASDRRSRLVASGAVHAGEPPRPARGDPTKMTSLRGMPEDHVGADRAFHEITGHAHQANPVPVAGTDPADSPRAGQQEPRRPSRCGASAAGIAHARTGRKGRRDVRKT